MLTEFERDPHLWAVLFRSPGNAVWMVLSQQPTREQAVAVRDSWAPRLERRERYEWAIVGPTILQFPSR